MSLHLHWRKGRKLGFFSDWTENVDRKFSLDSPMSDRNQNEISGVSLWSKQFWWSHRRAIGMLCTLVLAVFGGTTAFDFVNWDDPWYVLNNRLIADWSFSNLHGIVTKTVTRNYAPVTIFSYLLDRTIWGYWPGGYHFTNVLLHALNSVLVFILLKQVTGRHTIALFSASLFAIHPVQVESVVWISARKGLLSASFILLSLIYWLRRERSGQDELWGTGWYLLALLSKAVGIIVPGIVFVYDVLIRRKSMTEAFSRQFIGILMAIWLVLTTASSQKIIGGGIRHHFALGKLEMMAVDATLLWRYVAQLLWPAHLSVLYDPPIRGIALFIALSISGWGVIGFILWKVRHRVPLLLFAVACFFAPLVPVLNLFPITTLMNDRYLYLACIPFFAMMIAGLQSGIEMGIGLVHRMLKTINLSAVKNLSDTLKERDSLLAHRILITGLSIAVIMGAVRTNQYLFVWKNDRALWEHASTQTPELPVVQYQYALALWRSGDHQKAIDTLERASSLDRVDRYDQERFEKKRLEFQNKLKHLTTADPAKRTAS